MELFNDESSLLAFQNQQTMEKAKAYIRLHLNNGPLLQIRNVKKPRDLWLKLEALYKLKGFSLEFLLCKELFNITFINYGKSVEKYLM